MDCDVSQGVGWGIKLLLLNVVLVLLLVTLRIISLFRIFVVEDDRTVVVGEVPLPCNRRDIGHACFDLSMDTELFTVCHDCLGHDIVLGAWLTGLQIGLELLLPGLVPETVRA